MTKGFALPRSAITGALLVDGTDRDRQQGMTVIWKNDRIIWVGHDADADLGEATLFDARGGALLPGLIDSHVHLSGPAVLDGEDILATESAAALAIRSAQSAKRLLDVGITTARDQGSTNGIAIDVASAQRAGWLISCRVLAAGRGITPPGGHGAAIGVEVEGPEAVASAVALEIERGADVIKIFPTGGVLGSGAHGFVTTMTQEEVSAATAAAHAAGLLIGAHAHGPAGVEMCLEAGVDTIEHGTDLTAEQAVRMQVQGAALVPTLAAGHALFAHEADLPADLAERVRELAGIGENAVRRCLDAGVRILAGTDAGTPFNPPGGLATEIQILSALGLGPAGAIRSATSVAAEVLRLDDLGIIAVGKRADMMVVRGDPLDDLSLLAHPRAVVQDGKMRMHP